MVSHVALSFAEKSPVSLISVCPCFHNRLQMLIQEYMQDIHVYIYIDIIYIYNLNGNLKIY